MRHGSLFSGIGGFDLAAQWMGWDNVFHCEWNEFGQKVLKHHFPKSISYADITEVDFRHHRGDIDIISGGFPCQPYSAAGKRLGKEDDRHLWPEMLRCIREVSPRWVVGENVLGLVNWNAGMVFDEVQADLEAEGYEVQPYVLPACAVQAPHVRQRVWFCAYRNAPNSDSGRLERPEESGWDSVNVERKSISRNAPNSEQQRLERQREEWERCAKHRGDEGIFLGAEDKLNDRNAPDSDNEGLQRSEGRSSTTAEGQLVRHFAECAKDGNAPDSIRPTNWENFPTKPPICRGDDGLPRELDGITFPKWRNESIAAYGNAIVPQVALQIFKAIAQYEAR